MTNAHFRIESKYATELFQLAGYIEWETIHNGKKMSGYIRDLDSDKRFHIYYSDNSAALHLDKTINGKHRAVKWPRTLNQERKRIKKIYKNLLPITPKIERLNKRETKKIKRKLKDVYAPNLIELQKGLTQPIPKRSIIKKIIQLFK